MIQVAFEEVGERFIAKIVVATGRCLRPDVGCWMPMPSAETRSSRTWYYAPPFGDPENNAVPSTGLPFAELRTRLSGAPTPYN
jgi:hypothetical protein